MARKTQEVKDIAEGNLPDAAPANLIGGLAEGTESAQVNLQGLVNVEGVMEGTEPAQVNLQGLVNVEGVMEGPDLETDDTPHIQSLTVSRPNPGVTIIAARVMGEQGWVNKQQAIPGIATARQIATAIADIANWA